MRALVRSGQVDLAPAVGAKVVVEVTNELEVIDGVTASLDGGYGLTVTVEPPLLALFPDQTGILTLTLTPDATYPAGPRRLEIELRSSVEPAASTVVEIAAEVAAAPRGTVTVLPPVRRARRRARYSVVLDNTGNTVLDASLAASDPDRALTARFAPPGLVVPAGGSATTAMTVRAPRRFWGAEHGRILSVVATAPDLDLDTAATFRHRPLVPSGARTIAVLAVIVVAWAAIFVVALNHAFSKDPLAKDVPASFYAASPAAHTASGKTALGSLGGFRYQTAAADSAPAGAVPKSGVAIGIGGTITGTVTATSTQAGIGRITVEAIRSTPSGPSLVSSAATGNDGTYSIAGLLPGDYFLLFTAQGYHDVWYPAAPSMTQAVSVSVAAEAQTPGINAVVTGMPGSITGTVVTGSLTPVPVTVTVLPKQGGTVPVATVTTDGAGHYSIPNLLAPNSYDLSFSAPGYRVASDTEDLAGGEAHVANTVNLEAGPGTLGGSVTAGGSPLGGVTITASANGQTFTSATPTTGAVGQFTLANLPSPATYLLTFTKTGYGTQTVAEALGPGQSLTTLAVSMAGGAGQVSGTVTSSNGAPLGGVTVTVNGAAQAVSTHTLTAGQVGTYHLTGLTTPGTYTLTFSLAGYVPETVGVTLTSSGSAQGINATLPTGTATITGTVTTAGGGGLAGVTVTVTDGVTVRTTVTTSSPLGGYSITGLSPGAYSVTFSLAGYANQTSLSVLATGQTAPVSVALAAGG
ncbi:carboxypeptidase-like regulatory domain-containing protein [Acidiferrimicrobium sp. IK]|uniref:carboxypeptidase-like regulatory domain-containing protein n=1 Tax=Acidiferrimicrobium sp. IK TaxID=2871700 RepID=UPI0021CB2285|nr:carboxypeptidase-like regulatory domain-containing protein [Acidiferrimicrobium sp. IK]MCU4186055.1 carboxypeptidase-like regulatory domain-containing protein [Acidiferrimicrobium sp. IK]